MESIAPAAPRDMELFLELVDSLPDEGIVELPADQRHAIVAATTSLVPLLRGPRAAIDRDPTLRRLFRLLTRIHHFASDMSGIDGVRSLLALARTLIELGEGASAITLFERAHTLHSTMSSAPDLESLVPLYDDLLRLEWESYRVAAGLRDIGRCLNRCCGGMADPRRFDLPTSLLRRALDLRSHRLDPNDIEAVFDLASSLGLQSRYEELRPYLRLALQYQAEIARTSPLGKFGLRFFQTRSAIRLGFGHLTTEPDLFVKMKRLGWIPPYRGILLAPDRNVANDALLDYISQDVCVVTNASLVRRLEPQQPTAEYNSFWLPMPTKELHHLAVSYLSVQSAWEQERRPPLRTLWRSHRRSGRQLLEQCGMPSNAWFVTLHVRDQRFGKAGQRIEVDLSALRNARIETYHLAIKEITDRGGWVIRVGDVSMPPLPPLERVIDFAHRDLPDWADLFLAAECRFYIATASGPSALPTVFDVPMLMSNMAPIGFEASRRHVFLPKLYRARSTGQFLSLREMVQPPYFMCVNQFVFDHLGVEIVDNSPEELRDAVIEMLDRGSERFAYTSEDEELQEKVRSLAASVIPYGAPARMGSAFLRQHRHLLAGL